MRLTLLRRQSRSQILGTLKRARPAALLSQEDSENPLNILSHEARVTRKGRAPRTSLELARGHVGLIRPQDSNLSDVKMVVAYGPTPQW